MIAMGTAIAGLIVAMLIKDIDENNIEQNDEDTNNEFETYVVGPIGN